MEFKKILLVFIAVFILLSLVGLSYQFISTKIDNYRYPAPGKMVDVGGFKLHINCSGIGKPTVILDAGMGCHSTNWTFVQKGIEQFTHVCSYDRAGLGWSEESTNPRTSAFIAEELHTLLHNTNAQPPYILVGHSSGGINMRLYANTYPEEVFGVILVDSSNEKQMERFEEIEKCFPRELSYFERFKGYILTSKISFYLGITRLYFSKFENIPYPEEIKDVLLAKNLATKSLRTDESTPIKESLQQVEQSKNSLENKPLIVITAGKKNESEEELEKEIGKAWIICQKELAEQSKRCKQIIAEKSGHMINHEQPEIIVDAIREMVHEYNLQNTNY